MLKLSRGRLGFNVLFIHEMTPISFYRAKYDDQLVIQKLMYFYLQLITTIMGT